jgi:hypothetical protein
MKNDIFNSAKESRKLTNERRKVLYSLDELLSKTERHIHSSRDKGEFGTSIWVPEFPEKHINTVVDLLTEVGYEVWMEDHCLKIDW